MNSRTHFSLREPKRLSTRTSLIPTLCAIFSFVIAFDSPQTQLQLQSGCDPLPFTADTWQKLKLDKYISEYPGGRNLTVAEYASNVGAQNFKCGVSQWCNAGQMCYPVKNLDWYILFAIQEWNERMNNLYKAIGFSMSLVQENLLSIASSLFPQPDNLRIFSQKTHFAMGGLIASLLIGLLCLVPYFIGTAPITLFWIVGLASVPPTAVSIAASSTRYKSALQNSFDVASTLNYEIAQYYEKIQGTLRNQTHSLLNTGISNSAGMAGTLAGGSFLDPKNFPSTVKIESDLKNITLGISVSHILKSLNAFVTIGSDPCKSRGPNGAWSGDNVLSFCNSNGTMFNIVTVSGKKSKVQNHIPNVSTLSSKYGITPEYLTSSAIECQEKRNRLDALNANVTLSIIEKSQREACIIDLPVCDCRSLQFRERRKLIGTVRACREAGVPI